VVYKPPTYLLKWPLKPGDSWEVVSLTMWEVPNVAFNLTLTVESADETVTVPAGTFSHCAKIVGAASIQNQGQPVVVKSTEWYCPNSGLVKQLRTEFGPGPRGELSLQLESLTG
jgi:hypothetical protein